MQNMISTNITNTLEKEREFRITFSNKEVIGVLSHNNDPMVLTVQYDD